MLYKSLSKYITMHSTCIIISKCLSGQPSMNKNTEKHTCELTSINS